MKPDLADRALQRKNMVESQVRPSDVTDRRITNAMQSVAREAFVPAELADVAYMDDDLAVAPGRYLLAPRTFARLLQLAGIEDGDTVLIVGALSGYSAAVTARLAGRVVALESDAAIAAAGKDALSATGASNVACVSGPLVEGWAAAGPYDVILIEGGIEFLPETVAGQLKAEGRLAAIEIASGIGRAAVWTRIAGKGQEAISRRVAFEAAARCLPGFARERTFAF